MRAPPSRCGTVGRAGGGGKGRDEQSSPSRGRKVRAAPSAPSGGRTACEAGQVGASKSSFTRRDR
ncbi:MAG: hypothetical protein B7Z12_09685 [Caulobacter vibrioides]|uniref:Uncharacterized protein n=1 Tax=Caulobacter vibrioides TaxID=155892 RepID=A0A258D7P0_CAUVI|nr:MAG: hypothetical protein B7Z12_09685 [Caulobacter vibrioides]